MAMQIALQALLVAVLGIIPAVLIMMEDGYDPPEIIKTIIVMMVFGGGGVFVLFSILALSIKVWS